MGMIREQGEYILVMFEPDEIISERIGFKETRSLILAAQLRFVPARS